MTRARQPPSVVAIWHHPNDPRLSRPWVPQQVDAQRFQIDGELPANCSSFIQSACPSQKPMLQPVL
jgi:hypothetical protein